MLKMPPTNLLVHVFIFTCVPHYKIILKHVAILKRITLARTFPNECLCQQRWRFTKLPVISCRAVTVLYWIFLRCSSADTCFSRVKWTVIYSKNCTLHPAHVLKQVISHVQSAELMIKRWFTIHARKSLVYKCTVRYLVFKLQRVSWGLVWRAPPSKRAILSGPSQFPPFLEPERHLEHSLWVVKQEGSLFSRPLRSGGLRQTWF